MSMALTARLRRRTAIFRLPSQDDMALLLDANRAVNFLTPPATKAVRGMGSRSPDSARFRANVVKSNTIRPQRPDSTRRFAAVNAPPERRLAWMGTVAGGGHGNVDSEGQPGLQYCRLAACAR